MKSKGIKLFFGGIIFLAVLGIAVMLLWNWLIPGIFGFGAINFWQAVGLFILARILIGGFGRGGLLMGGLLHHHENPIHKKWLNMTPEQRKEFINKRRQFGFGGPWGRGRYNWEDQQSNNE